MKHRAHPDFWKAHAGLSPTVKAVADKNFELLKLDPRHPSLRLKKVGDYWSARVGLVHRALAIEVEGGLLWTWIGPHDEYNRLIGKG